VKKKEKEKKIGNSVLRISLFRPDVKKKEKKKKRKQRPENLVAMPYRTKQEKIKN